jgi:soluble lytic murein transglycosylase-like protein
MKWLGMLLAGIAAAQTPPAAMRDSLEKQKGSLARQRLSVRQQAQTAGVRLTPWDPPEAPCDAVDDAVLAPWIDGAAKSRKLQPELIRAVIEKESGFKPCAVSRKGAQGLMQLMPEKAAELGLRDPFDPKESIEGGAQFLKQLLDKYGDLAKALGAYNAGPAAVDKAGGVPEIPETKDYVETILKRLDATRTVQPSIPKPKPIEN